MNNHYVYRHIRKDTNEPFYVGIGTKQYPNPGSFEVEFKRAHEFTTGRSNHWDNIFNKTDIEVEILIESDDYEFINNKEIEFIKLYGRKDLQKGTLVNFCDGGLSLNGFTHSNKTKRKISKSKKGSYTLEWFIEKHGEKLGTDLYNERCNKISQTLKGKEPSNLNWLHEYNRGREFSEEHCKNISKANTGKKMHPNTRKALLKANTGKPSTQRIAVVEIKTGREFSCAREASEITGYSKGIIYRHCKNEVKTPKFEYLNKKENE